MSNKFQVVRNVWKRIILVFLLLIAFSYAMFQGGFVSWFLFYSFLPFALYAVCLSFYPLGRFSVERQFPKREFHADESLTVKVTLKRDSFFPLLLLIVEDHLSGELAGSMFQKVNKAFLYPGYRKEFSFIYCIEKLPRGEHHFSAVRIVTSDILGLVQREVRISNDENILVFPSYGNWSYKPIENSFEQGNMLVNDMVQRDMTMAVGIREYQPGDKLSWINWKASAKRSEIMMKEFEQRSSQDLLLIMDCSPHMYFELLVQYAASISCAALRKGARVGFMSVSEERVILPPQGGENSQRQLLYHLAKSKDKCPITIEQVLRTERFLLQQKANILLVTAQVSPELIEAAQMFTARKCPVSIFVIQGDERDVSSSKHSVKEMARSRGVDVQFVYGSPLSSGMKKEVAR